ncbi:MAG: uracil-DNA glycosylase [Sedimenticola sp.]
MFNIETALNPGWQKALNSELNKPYIKELESFLEAEYSAHKTVYPPRSELFSAFDSTPLKKVRVVIIGQDPYHGEGQAHGLCFSVRPGVRVPPSLRNIFKELHSDLGITTPAHGYLQSWAEQGVFLLNATLSVEEGRAASHQKQGWESFTDAVIQHLNDHREGLVFVLWGSHAQKKGAVIDTNRHLVLTAPHPSPLSAHRGFLGCGHFSTINNYLCNKGEKRIDWSLTT